MCPEIPVAYQVTNLFLQRAFGSVLGTRRSWFPAAPTLFPEWVAEGVLSALSSCRPDEVRDTAAAIGIGAERSGGLSSLNLEKDMLLEPCLIQIA